MDTTSHNFNFNRVWFVRHEPVYRLLDNKLHLDSFFENGELLISCFEIFKNYPNEIQGDKDEGSGTLIAKTTNEKLIGLGYKSGSNAYVLSTTKKIDSKILEDFKAVGGIKIKNPTVFGAEISNRVPFFIAGLEGNCVYQETRMIERTLTEEQTNRYSREQMQNLNDLDLLRQEFSNSDEMFIKLNKYSYQEEFRLIWATTKNITKSLIIKCPEAIQYCERVDF